MPASRTLYAVSGVQGSPTVQSTTRAGELSPRLIAISTGESGTPFVHEVRGLLAGISFVKANSWQLYARWRGLQGWGFQGIRADAS